MKKVDNEKWKMKNTYIIELPLRINQRPNTFIHAFLNMNETDNFPCYLNFLGHLHKEIDVDESSSFCKILIMILKFINNCIK